MELLIIVLPLLGSISAGLFGRFIGSLGAVTLTSSCMISSALISLLSVLNLVVSGSSSIVEMPWLSLSPFGMNFDFTALVMLSVVSVISSLVHLFSHYYLESDPHVQRFFSYLSLFTFFMMILLSADNLLLLFAGWEGVGLLSFLLIHFWFTRSSANLAALKAFFMNRFGDYALFVLILLVFSSLNTANLSMLSILMLPDMFFVFLFIGAIAKSAQLGLHTWLPSAMEGPTPVSALIHAATMVTAGVYLLIRFQSFYLALWIGALTALFGAVNGLLEYDIKKVIAYSTTSQLGYMFSSLSMSDLSLFHLVNHATFKALLFLTAGAFIHALFDEQDTRKYGGLFVYLPRPSFFLILGSLSLLAFPFSTGFFSKDLILQSLYVDKFLFLLTLVAAFFTALYSVRLVLFAVLLEPSFSRALSHQVSDTSSVFVWIPLVVLGVLSVLLGYCLSSVFYIVSDGVFLSTVVKYLLLCPVLLLVMVL